MEEKKNKLAVIENLRIGRILFFVFAFLFFILFNSLSVDKAEAATMYLAPPNGSYEVGKDFSENIYITSADQAANAVSGIISFPADKLEVTSLSKSGSIINLWVQEPSFSNDMENINFEGLMLSPGFTGTSGKIITVNFVVKSAGNAVVRFTSGSILANDGKGTNILSTLGSANFNLGTIVKPQTPKPVTKKAPVTPKATAPSQLEFNKILTSKDAVFNWFISNNIAGINILVVLRMGTVLITLISLLFPIIGLIALFIFIVWYFWNKFIRFRNRLHKEICHAEISLHRDFDKFRNEVVKQIFLLEKARNRRELNIEKRYLVKQLMRELSETKRIIKKKIDIIDKEIK